MNIFSYGSENGERMAYVTEAVKEQTREAEPNGTRGSPGVRYSRDLDIPYNERVQLNEYIISKNNRFDIISGFDCTEIGNNFYLWENYDKNSYGVILQFEIEGNEEIITGVRSEIKNGTFRNAEKLDTALKRSGENGRRAYSGNNVVDERKGTTRSFSRVPTESSESNGRTDISKGSRNLSNNQVKKSRELDTEYLKAVENGDMETAQRLVDEAAVIDLSEDN